MPKLFLIRHAEPSVTGVMLGQSDPPLSEAGKQAASVISVDAVIFYSSALKRAYETARRIPHSGSVVIMPDLNEIGLGDWDGLAWSEIETADAQLASAKLENWREVTPPNGESWANFESRVARAVAVIRDGPMPAAVVAHVTVNAAIAELVTGRDALAFRQRYCEMVQYEL